MLQRPDGRPDGSWATRSSRWPDRSWATRLLTKLAMSCCLLGKYQGLLNKSELKQASLENQIAPGDQIGRPDFHILVMSKIWLSIWSPGAIWSPIRLPKHLIVDLVVVDAFTLECMPRELKSELWITVEYWNRNLHHRRIFPSQKRTLLRYTINLRTEKALFLLGK